MKVNECMCTDVYSAKPETTIYDVVKIMQDRKIGCVPICDNNNSIVGLVTDRDILLRTVACNKDINTTTASDIMSTNVCTCKEDDDMVNAENKMSNFQIRRLPVCDENNCVIGILTMGDLAHHGKKIGEHNFSATVENICDCKGTIKNCC